VQVHETKYNVEIRVGDNTETLSFLARWIWEYVFTKITNWNMNVHDIAHILEFLSILSTKVIIKSSKIHNLTIYGRIRVEFKVFEPEQRAAISHRMRSDGRCNKNRFYRFETS
jgi:hypothetical protein